MRNLLTVTTLTSLLFASTAVWAQDLGQAKDNLKPRVYGSLDAGKTVQKTSVQTKGPVSDAELERVIEEAARIRGYRQGVQDATRALSGAAQTPGTPPKGQAVKANASVSQAHIVKKGETLYNLSKRYNVKISEIRSANNLTGNKIDLGQTLTIPSQNKTLSINTTTSQPVLAQAPVKDTSVIKTSPEAVKRVVLPVQAETNVVYAVLPKDTLYSISRRSCVKIEDLATANNISDPSTLKPGQKLNLPEGHCLTR